MRWISEAAGLLRVPLLTPFLLALSAQAQDAKPFTKEQLDQMTAQVALYPDSLLAQLFMATTYPDEFAAAAEWSKAHPDAKGDDAVKMVENEPWDPSVASMVAFPEVLITLGDKPDWVKNMGDAFLAQPEDVMDSVQRLRAAGAEGRQPEVERADQGVDAGAPSRRRRRRPTVVQQAAPPPQVIVIEPAQPSVVYVPAYNPAVVYGAWPYPAYPPYYYPPPPGYWFSRTDRHRHRLGHRHRRVERALGRLQLGPRRRQHQRQPLQQHQHQQADQRQRQPDATGTTIPSTRQHDYRGGNATRQNLDKKCQAGNREQYRGKDASRDASRERATQAMQSRGVGRRQRLGARPGADADATPRRRRRRDRRARTRRAIARARRTGAERDRDARARRRAADRSAAQPAIAVGEPRQRVQGQATQRSRPTRGGASRAAAQRTAAAAAPQRAAAAAAARVPVAAAAAAAVAVVAVAAAVAAAARGR